jgi:hypothetical protein
MFSLFFKSCLPCWWGQLLVDDKDDTPVTSYLNVGNLITFSCFWQLLSCTTPAVYSLLRSVFSIIVQTPSSCPNVRMRTAKNKGMTLESWRKGRSRLYIPEASVCTVLYVTAFYAYWLLRDGWGDGWWTGDGWWISSQTSVPAVILLRSSPPATPELKPQGITE